MSRGFEAARRGFVVAGLAVGIGGCQLGDIYIVQDAPPATGAPRTDAGVVDAGSTRPVITSAAQLLAFLDGRSMSMEAGAIPSHPNGYDENFNFGQATQCIHRVTMQILARTFRVNTELATLRNAPMPEDVGQCDRAAPSGSDLSFDTTTSSVENVSAGAECFDITLTYAGFGQEGRGRLLSDGSGVLLELFFRDQAIGHRCADGAVGARTVTLNQQPFTGDAVQHYTFD